MSCNDRIIIEFPLRGEWQAPTTPAKAIPSHGTNRMGMRYAFDFLQVGTNKYFHNLSFWRYFFIGVPLKNCYCWGESIYAPCEGEIIEAVDGIPERKIVHWLVDLAIAVKNAVFFDERRDKYSKIAGNYIVIKGASGVYLAFAHLQTGSIVVSRNDRVKKGMFLGKVGHSGNSTSPHLHFQVMDRFDIANSQGLPFVFEQYELFRNGVWHTVYHQVPADTERFRLLPLQTGQSQQSISQ